jgi:hypothetical protein
VEHGSNLGSLDSKVAGHSRIDCARVNQQRRLVVLLLESVEDAVGASIYGVHMRAVDQCDKREQGKRGGAVPRRKHGDDLGNSLGDGRGALLRL